MVDLFKRRVAKSQFLAEAQGSPTAYRELLRHAHEELKARFLAEEPVEGLVHARAALVDIVLREVWRAQSIPETAANNNTMF